MSITQASGAWVIYFYDSQPIAKSIHEDAEDVLYKLEAGDLVAYWPYETSLDEAIQKWEGKDSDEKGSN